MSTKNLTNDHLLPTKDYQHVHEQLLNLNEIALLDVREEAPHAEGHPLFAANFQLSRIEVNAYAKLPRKDVPIVTIDSGEGYAEKAAQRLIDIGYTDVSVFKGGIEAWKRAGGELFIDVNVPSKSFGELMESICHTPSLPAQEVKALIESGQDHIIVDVRRLDEYQTMCIPGGISVPGAELVLRIPEMVANPSTQIIVNCAGRTRGLLGTQSLINAGIPNPIAALRNGTIGWTLARQELELGQSRQYPEAVGEMIEKSQRMARNVADRAGVKRASLEDIQTWAKQEDRTTYFFDVRNTAEYEQGHLPGFLSIPGGQLVQELEMYAPVRGARIVLADDNGVRANMSASWLAQMAWEVFVLDGVDPSEFSDTGPSLAKLPPFPANVVIAPQTLAGWLKRRGDTVVIDLTRHANFRKGHIPGAWFLIRSVLEESIANLPKASRYVLTCSDSSLAQYVAPEIASIVNADVFVLAGGTKAWVAAGYELESGESNSASPLIDRYRRPYEGTEASDAAMQAYLDWEFGLIEQLGRDGTHHFKPLKPVSQEKQPLYW